MATVIDDAGCVERQHYGENQYYRSSLKPVLKTPGPKLENLEEPGHIWTLI